MITPAQAIEVLTNTRNIFGSECQFAEAIDLAVDRLRKESDGHIRHEQVFQSDYTPEQYSEAWDRTGGFENGAST